VRCTAYLYLTKFFFVNPFIVTLLSTVVIIPVLFSVVNAMVKGMGLGKELVYTNAHFFMTLWSKYCIIEFKLFLRDGRY
jgi:predicted Co/Zn/Cd cation transporter (cation efflux family)